MTAMTPSLESFSIQHLASHFAGYSSKLGGLTPDLSQKFFDFFQQNYLNVSTISTKDIAFFLKKSHITNLTCAPSLSAQKIFNELEKIGGIALHRLSIENQKVKNLKGLTSVDFIKLKDCRLSGDCFSSILAAIKANQLRGLSLQRCTLSDEQGRMLVEALTRNTSLQEIALEYCFTSDTVSHQILQSVRLHPKLTTVKWGEKSARRESDALMELFDVKRRKADYDLTFYRSDPRDSSLCTSLDADPQERTSTVQALSLSECTLSDENFESLLSAIQSNEIQSLSLNYHPLDANQTERLVDVLKNNQPLRVLNLNCCVIKSENIELDLKGNGIPFAMFERFHNFQKEHPHIEIKLPKNPFLNLGR